jgi:inosose dehydratase
MITRRSFLSAMAAAPLAAAPPRNTIGLAFGTYAMKALTAGAALQAIRDIGYDGVELCAMAGWPTDSARLTADDRRDLKRRLEDARLALPALQDSLPITGAPDRRKSNLERIKRMVDLGNELAPQAPPVIDTIAGGRTAEWDKTKGMLVEELREWAKIGEDGRTDICFKPHAGQAVHNVERALWLLREAGCPGLRIVYDFSHFSLEGVTLADSFRQLLPHIGFVAMKDSSGTAERHSYLLPGDGKVDYADYFRTIARLGYRGYASVEVSSQIHGKPGYDPVATARLCYERLAPVMERVGVQRPRHM